MTVNNELVHLGNPVIHAGNADLWLPEYVMPTLINTSIPTEFDLVTQAELQLYPISAKLVKKDEIWRYCKAGAAMAAGTQGFLKGAYLQVPGKAGNSVNAGFEGALYAAVVVGDTSFKIADTAAAKNLYAGAHLVVYNDTDAIYEEHEVIGNDVSNATTTTCYIASPGFKKALTTSMGIDIYLNRFSDIRSLLSVGANYVSAMGYAKMPITSAYYFWLQTAGKISGVTGASTWPGQTAYNRDVFANTDGSLIGANNSTTVIMYQRVGYLLYRTASDYGDNTIMLQLDQ